jgi:hypothetical protein
MHGFELPGQVVDVLHAGVGTARAEGRHLVRRVAGMKITRPWRKRSMRRQANW